MNHHERQKVYDLLSQYYPNARQLKDKKTLTAWGLALERFPYDDVKTAVINYAISNKFFPDLADITSTLVPANAAPAVAPVHMDQHAAFWARFGRIYRVKLQEALTAHGLPAFSGDTGAEYIAWLDMCMEAGLDVMALHRTIFRVAHSAEEVSQ